MLRLKTKSERRRMFQTTLSNQRSHWSEQLFSTRPSLDLMQVKFAILHSITKVNYHMLKVNLLVSWLKEHNLMENHIRSDFIPSPHQLQEIMEMVRLFHFALRDLSTTMMKVRKLKVFAPTSFATLSQE